MKTLLITLTMSALLFVVTESLVAEEITLSAISHQSIRMSEEADQSRFLLYFEIPDSLEGKEILLAELIIDLNMDSLSDEPEGFLLEISPVLSSWTGTGAERIAPSIETDHSRTCLVPLRVIPTQSRTINVHELVADWCSGALQNRGLLIQIKNTDTRRLQIASSPSTSCKLRIYFGPKYEDVVGVQP